MNKLTKEQIEDLIDEMSYDVVDSMEMDSVLDMALEVVRSNLEELDEESLLEEYKRFYDRPFNGDVDKLQ